MLPDAPLVIPYKNIIEYYSSMGNRKIAGFKVFD